MKMNATVVMPDERKKEITTFLGAVEERLVCPPRREVACRATDGTRTTVRTRICTRTSASEKLSKKHPLFKS